MEKKLTRLQKDTLKEIGSVGAGSASNALSKLTNKTVFVEMLEFKVISVEDILKLFKDPKKDVVGVIFSLFGDVNGVMLNLSTKETALAMSDMVNGEKVGTTTKLTSEAKDLLKEVMNILMGSYVAAIADWTKLKIMGSVPLLLRTDPLNLTVERALRRIKGDIENVIFIDTMLVIDNKKFRQEIILMLKSEMFDKLFNRLFKDLK